MPSANGRHDACGRPVYWARLVRDVTTKVPLDHEPNQLGGWRLDERGFAYRDHEAHLTAYPDPEAPGGNHYSDHRDTCGAIDHERAPIKARSDTGDGIDNR